MSDRDVVIRVEGISKLYRLGEVGTGSLAHDVNRWWHRVRGKEDPYLKIGEVNDRTKPAKQASSKKSLTTEDTESTEGAAGVRLAGQAGAEFPNPSTSELARDSENASLIRSANAPRSSEEQSDSKALDSRPSSLDSPKAQAPSDWVYALKDVSFEVKRGEVLGIIGRNGAGKSTLLKILSRVTTQSSGQIKVKGRIASLLEVGTGFHPELTGRENIFLNGAILGMRKAEIARKFDEIVEFSGCARYIDTPVKRYSSGMYVRLAFAVAAHLEPEILIVDEVLAVGDAEFQKKCLGKMKDVAGHGRTILFVSHNMAAILSLCTKVVWFNNGRLINYGDTRDLIDSYLSKEEVNGSRIIQLDSISRTGDLGNKLSIEKIEWLSPLPIKNSEDFALRIFFQIKSAVENISLGFGFNSLQGQRLLTYDTDYASNIRPTFLEKKFYFVDLLVKENPLAPGVYTIDIGARSGDNNLLDLLTACAQIEIVIGRKTPSLVAHNSGSGVRMGGDWVWNKSL
jgi:lipopolysaccharide transport system ATP-binding protein